MPKHTQLRFDILINLLLKLHFLLLGFSQSYIRYSHHSSKMTNLSLLIISARLDVTFLLIQLIKLGLRELAITLDILLYTRRTLTITLQHKTKGILVLIQRTMTHIKKLVAKSFDSGESTLTTKSERLKLLDMARRHNKPWGKIRKRGYDLPYIYTARTTAD